MTAPEPREDVAVAEVLALITEHGRCFPAISGRPDWCSGCEWTGSNHDQHLAEVLTRLVAERVRRAAVKAWDEGFDAGERDVFEHQGDGYDGPCIPNPYRADRRAER